MDSAKRVIASAPGKLILFGEQSVVLNKTAIATAISLRVFTEITSAPSVILELHGAMFDGTFVVEWQPAELHQLPGEAKASERRTEMLEFITSKLKVDRFIQSIQSFLFLYLMAAPAHAQTGIRVVVQSQLPMGGGLGSSAAFNTSLCLAMLQYFSNEKAEVPRDLIREYSFECEKFMHGNPSGIDNAVSTYGGIIGFKSGTIQSVPKVPSLDVLVTDTTVSRNTKILVQGVGNLFNEFPEVVGPILDSMDAISVHVLGLFQNHELPGEKLETELEKLIAINHHCLGAISVGHETLDRILHLTKKYNLSSKLTGAGGGGCAFTLLRKETKPETVSEVTKELTESGFRCFRVQIGCPGAQIHDSIPDNIQFK